MRWGEVCGMRRTFLHLPDPQAGADARADAARAWYEIDPRVGAVHEDVHSRRYFGPPKGGRGRIIELPPFLAGLLARHLEAIGDRDLLFVNRAGAPIRHSDWLRAWHTACDGTTGGTASRGGLAPVCRGARFHDLRHAHATMLVELGVPEVLRDERLGHKPPGVRGIYTHTTAAMRTAMTTALELTWQQAAMRAGHGAGQAFADDGPIQGGRDDLGGARCGRTMVVGHGSVSET
jgi:integrase